MSNQRLANGRARTWYDLQYSSRQAGLVSKLTQQQSSQWGERRRFEHHAITRRKRRRGLPTGDGKRKIPRHNTRYYSHWLPQREIESPSRHWYRLPAEAGDCAGIILEDPRA